jgi:hypothetical protein
LATGPASGEFAAVYPGVQAHERKRDMSQILPDMAIFIAVSTLPAWGHSPVWAKGHGRAMGFALIVMSILIILGRY